MTPGRGANRRGGGYVKSGEEPFFYWFKRVSGGGFKTAGDSLSVVSTVQPRMPEERKLLSRMRALAASAFRHQLDDLCNLYICVAPAPYLG